MENKIYQVRNKDLSRLIAYYWCLDCDTEGDDSCTLLYPEPYFDIIFSFGEQTSFQSSSGNREEIDKGFICGMRKECFQITSPGKVSYLAVRFYPQGIYPILGIPLSEFTNQNVELALTDLVHLKELEKRVSHLTKPELVIEIIEQYFLLILRKSYVLSSYPLAKLLPDLHEKIKLKQIYHKNLSSRTVEREFQKWIGVSPKFFQRIIRFNNLMLSLNNYDQQESFSQFAQRFDYFDQSHMIKDFQQFLNMSPGQYIKINQG